MRLQGDSLWENIELIFITYTKIYEIENKTWLALRTFKLLTRRLSVRFTPFPAILETTFANTVTAYVSR
jgi:hypothetical protein